MGDSRDSATCACLDRQGRTHIHADHYHCPFLKPKSWPHPTCLLTPQGPLHA